MIRKLAPSFLAVFLLIISGCTRPTTATQRSAPETYVSVPGAVGFDLESIKEVNGSQRFLATYRSQRRVAKFAIEFGPTRTTQGMKTGDGKFVAERGSDATALLSDLQKALEAKAIPSNAQRVEALPFTFVNIGDNLSQAPDGGFNVDPPGGWTAIKIFIGEGEQEGEVFVNLNLAIGRGQFCLKDADHGDLVLKQLVTVL